MGSQQSTSEENYNSNATANRAENSDPWWRIENNESFTLDHPTDTAVSGEATNNPDLRSSRSEIYFNANSHLDKAIRNTNNPEVVFETSEKNFSESATKLNNKHKNTQIGGSSVDDIRNQCVLSENSLPIAAEGSEQTLEQFKKELNIKRMARQTAVDELRNEITNLRNQLAEEREINRKLRNGEVIGVKFETVDACVSTYDLADQNDEHDSAIHDENNKFEESLKEMVKQLQKDLAETHYNLQMTNSENISLNTEVAALRKQIGSLKDVVACSKQMIEVREEQVSQLKTKLIQIEESLADRETKLLSEDLRREYDKQMENIRNLRQLYEERARVCSAERENLLRQIQIKKDELAAEIDKTKNLEERNGSLENDVQAKQNEIEEKISECKELKYENHELKEEMGAINLLFSQMLTGFNGNNCLDIDRFTVMLEENRTLLKEIATKEANYENASLPKLLFDIVKQANCNNEGNDNDNHCHNDDNAIDVEASISNAESENANKSISLKETTANESHAHVESTNTSLLEESTIATANDVKQEQQLLEQICLEPQRTSEVSNDGVLHVGVAAKNDYEQQANADARNEGFEEEKLISAQEIIGNLPKVWRILMELLNHQKIEKVDFVENGQSEDCFKSVPSQPGVKPELSVSKTYIKLKNLILEKKSLVKETNRLKTLNSHLEYRMNEQEKRLSAVSLELQKTWHLVGRMQRQHRQLHTHEQILRYQLQQKRRLLNELKEELEYCRRKWAAARAKNLESQLQCDDMRKEFAKRRQEDFNNSAESGYSDGAASGTDEEDKEFENKNGAAQKIPPHKFVHDFIENSRILNRCNSMSPTRSLIEPNLIRCQSTPAVDAPVSFLIKQLSMDNVMASAGSYNDDSEASTSRGAVSKPQPSENSSTEEMQIQSEKRERIQRLEEQCKSLIARVNETSGSREKLEIQIKRCQVEMPPAQHPVHLKNFFKATRSSKSPSPEAISQCRPSSNRKGQLTEREEEYTRRRSERIQRLENESKQLMSKIRKTNDRGVSMVIKIKEIHARCISSREGSVDRSGDELEPTTVPEDEAAAEGNAIETENVANCETKAENKSDEKTNDDDSYMARFGKCAERLKRLEEEGQKLLSKWTRNTERGIEIESKLDEVHSKYSSDTVRNTGTASNERNSPQKSVQERLKEVEDKANSRNERLRQMEIESKALITKLTQNSDRGSHMIDRLKASSDRRNSLKREQEKLKKEMQENSTDDELAQRERDTEQAKEESIVRSTQLTGTKPKVKTLPKTGVAALALSRHAKSKSDTEKTKTSNAESLEEMFMRLSGIPTPGPSTSQTKQNDAVVESQTNNVSTDSPQSSSTDDKKNENNK